MIQELHYSFDFTHAIWFLSYRTSGVTDHFAEDDSHALYLARRAVANLNRMKTTNVRTEGVEGTQQSWVCLMIIIVVLVHPIYTDVCVCSTVYSVLSRVYEQNHRHITRLGFEPMTFANLEHHLNKQMWCAIFIQVYVYDTLQLFVFWLFFFFWS